MAVMTASEFAKKCYEIATEYKTTYVWGGCGMPITNQTIADKVAQYPLNRTSGYEADAKKLVGYKDVKHGGGAWMFDCVCMIKSVLWGWKGDWNKYYGGAVYCSNGVPDVSADGMIQRCQNVSTNFGNLAVGEALWLPGHIGVYIGNGLAVECTPAWKSGCQVSAVGNIGSKQGYPTRSWQKHGKLPYVSYDNAPVDVNKSGKIIVDGVTYPVDIVLKDGTNYIKVRDLAAILGLKVSNIGSTAVLYTK